MARIILLLLIGVAIWWLFRSYLRSAAKRDAPPPRARMPEGEDMVQCARCGVNLPRSEAREEAGRLVCASNPKCH